MARLLGARVRPAVAVARPAGSWVPEAISAGMCPGPRGGSLEG